MTDRLLLNTYTCSWLMHGDRMSAPSLQAIGEAQASRSGIYVLAITTWEVATLVRKGRYRLLVLPKVWFTRLLAVVGVRLAELTPEIRIESTELPGKPPADPADRTITATARHQGLVLVSRDRRLIGYGDQGYVRTLTCRATCPSPARSASRRLDVEIWPGCRETGAARVAGRLSELPVAFPMADLYDDILPE
jgi:PIN domain nuclease of toxin-antitoxin system